MLAINMAKYVILPLLTTIPAALAHRNDPTQTILNNGLLGDAFVGGDYHSQYGPQIDLPFTGPLSFAHLPYSRCLDDQNQTNLFDVAIIGMPFDTAVSYRPGARFGPNGIRSGSRRLRYERGYSLAWESTPYASNGTLVVDCGDVGISFKIMSIPC